MNGTYLFGFVSKVGVFLLPALVGGMFLGSPVNAAELEGLGDLTGDTFLSKAFAVNSDGSVVVGSSRGTDGNEAFRWTEAGGMVGLGDLPGSIYYSQASGVSGDGSVVVGYSYGSNGAEAFRWTKGDGMVGLGDLSGGLVYSIAEAVSGDGLTVVGKSGSVNSGSYAEAFRWASGGGMVGLGDFAGGVFSSDAFGVNSDGSVVVGYGTSAVGKEAFRWTASGGMVGLGYLAGGSLYSQAYAVNDDGSVVVGESDNGGAPEAFRWTASGGMVGLGELTGGAFESSARGVNADGSVVVGNSIVGYDPIYDEDISAAFRWTAATGMQSLSEWLAESGYSLSGWTDTTATGVSDDGKIVVGSGQSTNGTEAFIARGGSGLNGSGLIGITSFSASLESVNSIGAQGIMSVNMTLHGAHGHPGATRALDEKYILWAAGDVGFDDRHDSTDNSGVGELGVGYRYNGNLFFSLALGKTYSDSDLRYDGSSDSDGHYIAIDTDIQLPTSLPLYLSFIYLYGESDLDIKRGYENAGSLDASLGDAEQSFYAFRSRLQWQSAKRMKSAVFHPYIEYNFVKVTTDGYTETGGGFPAVFDESKEKLHDWRLGLDADYTINEENRVFTTVEGVHRTEKNSNGISGNVIGLFAFNIDGREYKQEWLRGSLGLEHKLSTGRITVTLNAATEGGDPNYWAGLTYSIGF